jgi:hypothetical protein
VSQYRSNVSVSSALHERRIFLVGLECEQTGFPLVMFEFHFFGNVCIIFEMYRSTTCTEIVSNANIVCRNISPLPLFSYETECGKDRRTDKRAEGH